MGGGTGGCLGAGGLEWAGTVGGVEWAGTVGGVEWAETVGGAEWAGTVGGVEWAGRVGGIEWAETVGGASRSPAVTGGIGLLREESSTFKDTVRGGGLAMRGAEDEDDEDDDEEEGGTGAVSVDEEEEAISHLGGRMACLEGGWESLVEALGAGLGSGTNRTPTDPNGEHKTHAQTYINTNNKTHTGAQHNHSSRHE